jgi:hypothetical protein
MTDRLFFSTEGINWDDDASIEAFAHNVWQQAANEFKKDQPESDEAGKIEDPEDPAARSG